MSDQLDKKSILEMSMGAILERVDYEMGKVMDNILAYFEDKLAEEVKGGKVVVMM